MKYAETPTRGRSPMSFSPYRRSDTLENLQRPRVLEISVDRQDDCCYLAEPLQVAEKWRGVSWKHLTVLRKHSMYDERASTVHTDANGYGIGAV
ncbi:hypothetical protein TNCV_194111 [Trichonephila clavipes]|nr:hypothetical protein TNCV_194111 [Trichonephila clavipes]